MLCVVCLAMFYEVYSKSHFVANSQEQNVEIYKAHPYSLFVVTLLNYMVGLLVCLCSSTLFNGDQKIGLMITQGRVTQVSKVVRGVSGHHCCRLWVTGFCIIINTVFPCMRIPMIKIRRSWPSYLYHGDPCTDKTSMTSFLNWDGHQKALQIWSDYKCDCSSVWIMGMNVSWLNVLFSLDIRHPRWVMNIFGQLDKR